MTFDPSCFRNRPGIADGDVREALLARGWDRGRPVEFAVLDRPEVVRGIAETFLDAGAGLVITPTAGANAFAMDGSGVGSAWTPETLRAANRRCAELYAAAVRECASGERFALGAMGPCPQLMLLGEVSEQELAAAYDAQARALADGGIHGIICVGFVELEALVAAVKSAIMATGLPVIGMMRFDSGAEQQETTLGVTPPQASAALKAAGAVAVGCEGSENPNALASIVSIMREACDLPVMVRVQAGQAELLEGEVTYPETPETFAERLDALWRSGAAMIGGGCGTTDAHIAALSSAVRKLGRKRT